MDEFIAQIFVMLVIIVTVTFALQFYMRNTFQVTEQAKAQTFVNNFQSGLSYLLNAYNGAEYTVVNPYRVMCSLKTGLANFTTVKNVPYVQLYCPPVNKTFYYVKLAVNSSTIIDSPYVNVYRVNFDGNLTIYVRG